MRKTVELYVCTGRRDFPNRRTRLRCVTSVTSGEEERGLRGRSWVLLNVINSKLKNKNNCVGYDRFFGRGNGVFNVLPLEKKTRMCQSE